MSDDIEPGWFVRWKNNDYTHFKKQVANIETKVNLSWKLQLVVLAAILTGAIGIIIAVVWRGL